MRFFIHTLICLMLISSVSCDTEDISNIAYDRLIIVFMAGTDELEGDIELKIKALEKGMGKVDAFRNKTIVCIDSPDYGFRIAEIGESGLKTIRQYAKDSAVTLHDAMTYIMQYCKAETYGLIVFGHSDRGYIFNGTRHETDIAGFASSLPVPLSGKYEFIVFETCFMSCIEMAYQLREKALYIMSSSAEILSPGYAECYASCLNLLFDRRPSLERFAGKYFLDCTEKDGIYSSATVSVLDLSATDSLVDDICDVLAVSGISSSLDGIQSFDRREDHFFYDLGDFIGHVYEDSLSVSDSLSAHRLSAFSNSMSRVVLYENSTESFMNSFAIDKHCGVTTFITSDILSDSVSTLYSSLDYYNRIRQALLRIHR